MNGVQIDDQIEDQAEAQAPQANVEFEIHVNDVSA